MLSANFNDKKKHREPVLNWLLNSDLAGKVRMYSLGRHAFLQALHVARLQPGRKVLVPSFICREVLAPIHIAGAVPAFYPVDAELRPLLPPPSADVSVVVAVNYFGFAQPLEPFRAYCARHGACLIEDNAHGFLGTDAGGKPLGSRGDIGIFSFRKSVPSPDGAALVVNRDDWSARLPEVLPCREGGLSAAFAAKRILRQVQDATGLRTRATAERAVRRLRRIRTGYAFPASEANAESTIPGPPQVHCESMRILKHVDAAREAARRRELYYRLANDLAHLDIQPLCPELATQVPYGYPFRSDERAASTAARIADENGLSCARWPALPDAVSAAAPPHYLNVWWINFLC